MGETGLQMKIYCDMDIDSEAKTEKKDKKNRVGGRESERENMKEKKERHRDRRRSVNTRMSHWSRHLHSAPGFVLPAGILDCFKVPNWRTHHTRHTLAHMHTLSLVQRE